MGTQEAAERAAEMVEVPEMGAWEAETEAARGALTADDQVVLPAEATREATAETVEVLAAPVGKVAASAASVASVASVPA